MAVAQNVVLLLATYAVAAGALGTALPAPLPPALAAALLGGLLALLVPLPLLALRTGGVVARPAAGFAGSGLLGSAGHAARGEDGGAGGGGKGWVPRLPECADGHMLESKAAADARSCEAGRDRATVVTIWAGAEDCDEPLRAPLLGCKVGVL